MRTTVTLAEKLIKEVLQFSGSKNKTQAVNKALNEWLKQQKINRLKALRGKLDIQDNLDELDDLEREELKNVR